MILFIVGSDGRGDTFLACDAVSLKLPPNNQLVAKLTDSRV